MGAEQPALGEGEHEVDRRQPERRVTPGPGEVDRLVAVALGGEAVVAAPAVGRDLGRAADVAAEEALEARGRGVGDRLQAQPAEPPSVGPGATALHRPLSTAPPASVLPPATRPGLRGLAPPTRVPSASTRPPSGSRSRATMARRILCRQAQAVPYLPTPICRCSSMAEMPRLLEVTR